MSSSSSTSTFTLPWPPSPLILPPGVSGVKFPFFGVLFKLRLDNGRVCKMYFFIFIFSSLDSSPETIIFYIFFQRRMSVSTRLISTVSFPPWSWIMRSRTLKKLLPYFGKFILFLHIASCLLDRPVYGHRVVLTLRRWYVSTLDCTGHPCTKFNHVCFRVTLELGVEIQCYSLPPDTHFTITRFHFYPCPPHVIHYQI